MKREKNSAQSFVAYAMLIAISASALMVTRTLVVRVVQEKFRQSADVFGQGEQYQRGRTVVSDLEVDPIPIVLPPPPDSNPCTLVVGTVSGLEEEAGDLRENADTVDRSADDLEAPLLALQEQAAFLADEISQKSERARDLRDEATAKTGEADAKQAQLDQYGIDYPGCFGFFDSEGIPYPCPDDVAAIIAQLQIDIPTLRRDAAAMNEEAAGLEAEVVELGYELEPLNNAIAQLQGPVMEQAQEMRATATDFRDQADEKQRQADQYRTDYPDCF